MKIKYSVITNHLTRGRTVQEGEVHLQPGAKCTLNLPDSHAIDGVTIWTRTTEIEVLPDEPRALPDVPCVTEADEAFVARIRKTQHDIAEMMLLLGCNKERAIDALFQQSRGRR